jgi:hypothetical protein
MKMMLKKCVRINTIRCVCVSDSSVTQKIGYLLLLLTLLPNGPLSNYVTEYVINIRTYERKLSVVKITLMAAIQLFEFTYDDF